MHEHTFEPYTLVEHFEAWAGRRAVQVYGHVRVLGAFYEGYACACGEQGYAV